MIRPLLICTALGLSFAAPGQAATFAYSGEVDSADGVFSVLLPVGTSVVGTFEFDVPGPNQTTVDSNDLLFAEILMILPNGMSGFCFAYNTDCTDLSFSFVPIAAVTDFSITFDAAGFPALGVIELYVIVPSDPSFFLLFDLSDDTFALFANGVPGTISGPGDFQPQLVPVPSAVWLFASGVLAFIGLRKRRHAADF